MAIKDSNTAQEIADDNAERESTKNNGEALEQATLILGRAGGVLDLIFMLSVEKAIDSLCQGTLTAAIDTVMEQIRESVRLIESAQ